MLTVDQAQTRILAGVSALQGESVPLAQAYGRILSAPVTALRTQPPFAASAMDGYAIRWDDRTGPWQIIGESAAGKRFVGNISSSQAVRIFTGAPLPSGADTVIVQEDVQKQDFTLHLTGDGPPKMGAHIRLAGLDFIAGDVLAAPGDRVTPAAIGLFAAAGHADVQVYRRPRIAILATGDELVPPGHATNPDQIISSNGAMLAALFAPFAEVIDAGIAPDKHEKLHQAISGCASADIVLTIGGASVGDHDLVKPVLEACGASIDFWKVAMRPGKPMLSGMIGTQHVIGLPGNPVSAYVCAILFAMPLARQLAGEKNPLPLVRTAQLCGPLPGNGDRRDYMRATATLTAMNGVSQWQILPANRQDSSMLRTLAIANALLIREAGAASANDGDLVSFLLLDTQANVA